MKAFRILASICVCLGLSSGSAFATITIVQATGSNYVYSVTHPTEPWVVFVDPANEVTYQSSASQDMMSSLATEFSGWNFTYHSGGLAGTLTINYYKAAIDGDSGGATIDTTYVPDAGDPANLTMIQLVTTDSPYNHSSTPYIDVLPNATTPFYPYVQTDPQSGVVSFYDFSKRPGPTEAFTGKTWRGELLLASWAGGSFTNVDVYEGILWACIEVQDSSM